MLGNFEGSLRLCDGIKIFRILLTAKGSACMTVLNV